MKLRGLGPIFHIHVSESNLNTPIDRSSYFAHRYMNGNKATQCVALIWLWAVWQRIWFGAWVCGNGFGLALGCVAIGLVWQIQCIFHS